MRRDAVLLAEIVNAVGRIVEMTTGPSAVEIEVAPDRRDSLLWNFMVLGTLIGEDPNCMRPHRARFQRSARSTTA